MSYANEYKSALRNIEEQNANVRNLSYFLSTATQWHAFFEDDVTNANQFGAPNPMVVVLGYGVPEQLIYACHTRPLHLLGGPSACLVDLFQALPPRRGQGGGHHLEPLFLRIAGGDQQPLLETQ